MLFVSLLLITVRGRANPIKTLPLSRLHAKLFLVESMGDQILILNPQPGSATKTSEKSAARYIRNGKAVMTLQGLIFTGNRQPSDIYVQGAFDIRIVDSWRFPHTQWVHGNAGR